MARTRYKPGQRVLITSQPCMDELKKQAEELLNRAYKAGVSEGIRQGRDCLDVMAAIVPASVTKQWMVDEARRYAEWLRAKE